MNESQAMKAFIKDNFHLLTSDKFENKRFREQRKITFVDRHKKKFSLPNLSDVCEELVLHLKKSNHSKEKLTELFETLPIFKNIGASHRKKIASIIESGEYTSAISADDIENIRKVGAFEAVARHKGHEIAKQARQTVGNLEKDIQGKRAEKEKLKKDLEELKSVLDDTTFEEPNFDEDDDFEKTWWERFYLRKNPFAVQAGLATIEPELWEEVVLKTQPFRSLLSRFKKDKTVFFNTAFLLAGNFGFGKTTLLNYLEGHLFKNEIVTVLVTTGRQHGTAKGYIDSFYQELKTAIQGEIELTGSAKQVNYENSEEAVFSLCKELLRLKKGIVIFLDDYHKHEAQISSVIDFLGMLQILKDRLTRERMNVGFVVSGLPDWEAKRRQFTQMGGFLDGQTISMPEVTPEAVAEVFNKRLAAYCYDTNPPTTLSEHWIGTVFKRIGSSLSYRDYLNEIIEQLDQDNDSIVNTPFALDDEELNTIRATFEANAVAKAAIHKLINESHFKRFTKKQIMKCLEVFVQVGLRQGVTETDPLFIENEYYFQLLKQRTLIQKQKFNTKENKREFKWVIHKTIQKTIDEIQSTHKRSISDYFLKLYGDTNTTDDPNIVPQTDHPKPLASILKHELGKAEKEHLQKANQYYESIVLQSEIKSDQRTASIDRLNIAFDSLLNAYFIIDGSTPFFDQAKILDIRQQVSHHYLNTESITESFRRRHEYANEPTKLNFEKTLKSTKESFDYVAEILEQLLQDIAGKNQPMPFRHRSTRHSSQANELFKTIQQDYYSPQAQKHFQYVEQTTDMLEDRFRNFFFLCTNLAYGDENYFEHVPADAKRYAYKNMAARSQFTTFANKYHGFTRPQFRDLFTSGLIKEQIINPTINLPWVSADWKKFLDLFCEENIKTAHNLHATFSVEERDRYVKYGVLAEQILAEINQTIANMIGRNAFIVADDDHSPGAIENCMFRFGFKLKSSASNQTSAKILKFDESDIFIKQQYLADHTLDSSAYQNFKTHITHSLKDNEYLIEDFLDLNYLRDHYGLPLNELMCCFSYACHGEKIIRINPWFGSQIIISLS